MESLKINRSVATSEPNSPLSELTHLRAYRKIRHKEKFGDYEKSLREATTLLPFSCVFTRFVPPTKFSVVPYFSVCPQVGGPLATGTPVTDNPNNGIFFFLKSYEFILYLTTGKLRHAP